MDFEPVRVPNEDILSTAFTWLRSLWCFLLLINKLRLVLVFTFVFPYFESTEITVSLYVVLILHGIAETK